MPGPGGSEGKPTRVQGFRVWDSGFIGFRVKGVRFRVYRVQGLWGSGFRA